MNTICINGRLTTDPIFRELENSNAVCTLFIANNVYFGASQKANFLKVTAWGEQGRIIAEHARIGTELYITGRLEQSTYTDRNGATVYDVGIVVEKFNFGMRPAALVSE
jgi:single stranded DNA-binding protein